jgi:hypothetical protein
MTVYETINLPEVLYECERWFLPERQGSELRRIFGPRTDEVTGEYNEKLHNLRSSSRVIKIMKSRKMRWVVHVACVGRQGTHIEYWWEIQQEGDH